MTGEGSTQDWDAYPPGAYVPPAPPVPPQGHWPAYGPPPGYGPPGYGPPGFGPPPGYGPPAYGPPPGYGPAAYWPPAPLPWPHGPARPGAALTAGVLGFVTGGLTILVSLIVLLAVIDGENDASTVLILLGFPCAVAVIAGAAVLIRRGPPRVLFGGALASVGVLLLVGIVGAATQDADTVMGMVFFGVFALPLPILTAVFARLPQVRGWAAAG